MRLSQNDEMNRVNWLWWIIDELKKRLMNSRNVGFFNQVLNL